MIVLPDEAAIEQLRLSIAAWDAWFHLYVVELVLGSGTTSASLYEAECTAPGYAPIHVTDWTDPVIVAGVAQTTAPDRTFTRSAGDPQQQVYGYFVTKDDDGPLLWVERGTDPPYAFRVSTDQVIVRPYYSRRQQVIIPE